MNVRIKILVAISLLVAVVVVFGVLFSEDPLVSKSTAETHVVEFSAKAASKDEDAVATPSIGLSLLGLAISSGGQLPKFASEEDTHSVSKEVALLANGDGHDWLELSTKGRLELCLLIEQRTGRHNMIIFRNFLFEFYDKANREDPKLLDMKISELAAIAAVLELIE